MLLVLSVGCSRVPQLRQYDDRANALADEAPIVVVGLVEDDEPIGHTVPARNNPDYPMQLRRAKVHVENVLRGVLAEHTLPVYYFAFAGGYDGPAPLSLDGGPSRRVLWLRKDQGAYRTACDGRNCTLSIMSGAHPGYRPELGESLDQALIDLLLTRGDGPINDHQFAGELDRGLRGQALWGYTIEKLRHLALTESSEVKYAACRLLWTIGHGRPDDRLRRGAEDSVSAAGCTCREVPPTVNAGQIVACQ